VQGTVLLLTGRASYQHPGVNAGLLLAALLESVIVLSMFYRRGEVRGALPTAIDVSFGVVALLAMIVVTTPNDRSAWINWACPYTYGSLVIAMLALRRRTAGLVTLGFVGLYLGTVWSSLTAGGSLLSTSLANAVTYVGLFVAGSVFFRALRRSAHEVEVARAEAVSRGARLATERERNAQHRLLHDSALQTIEIIAGSSSVDEMVRAQARREATRLRLALRGDPVGAGANLLLGLEHLALDFTGRGLRVQVADAGLTDEVHPDRVASLCGAAREGLANVLKHSGVATAVVSARSVSGNVEVTIRDHGCGFEPSAAPPGFGLRESVAGRLRDSGGTVEVWTAPGRGVRLTLVVPA